MRKSFLTDDWQWQTAFNVNWKFDHVFMVGKREAKDDDDDDEVIQEGKWVEKQ